MNIFNKVTLQSLRKNKTRTIVTIIGIVLSASLICAVTTSISSFQNYIYENAVYSVGEWHAQAANADKKLYEDINSSEQVDFSVANQQLGYAKLSTLQNEYKPYLYVIGAQTGFEKVMPVHITSGRYPKSDNEILLPLHLWENGGAKYNIGDILTLELGERNINGISLGQNNPCYNVTDNGVTEILDEEITVRETRKFTVVGFYERPSFEDYSAPGYTAITLADKDGEYLYDVYFKMNNAKEVYSFVKEYELEGEINSSLLTASGTSRYQSFYTVLYRLAAIIIVLIMLGSISLIYNAFSISVSERTKQFGLLSSVGATKRQLRKMVLFEALTVSFIGIPLGILVGIGGIWITFLIIGEKFASILSTPIIMHISVSFEAVLIACVVAVVTVLISAWIPSKRATKVSAIDAIRQSTDIKIKSKPIKTSKIVYKVFGLPGMLASKHYKRNRRRYRATVISLFMSIVLFVSAASFTDYLTESVESVFTNGTYDLSLSYSNEEFRNIDKEDFLNKVENTDSITDAMFLESYFSQIAIDKSYLTDEAIEKIEGLGEDRSKGSALMVDSYVYFINDAEFKKLLENNNLSEKEYMNTDSPLGIAVDCSIMFDSEEEKYVKLKYLNSDKSELELNVEKKIEGYYWYDYKEDENGNQFSRYVNNSNSEDVLEIPLTEASVTYTLSTGKNIYEAPYYSSAVSGLIIIYPYSMLEYTCPEMERQGGYYYMLSDNHKKSYNALKKLLDDNGLRREELFDYEERVEEERNIIIIIQVFAYGFIILISLIAAANVFNTISTNISLRRREFAMLKSVGMAGKGFNRMMNFECMLYGSKALLYGLPVSAFFAILIYKSVSAGYEADFRLPWSAIGISVLSVFIVVFVTMMYSMAKIKKENPIDALKNENI